MKIPAIETQELEVWKTGLPFYDSARLIGAAHRHFGTASVEVEDQGTRWVLRGPRLRVDREPQQLGWVLSDLPEFPSSVKALRRNVRQALEPREEDPTEGGRRRRSRRAETMLVYYYLESALQKGARGPDPLSSYRFLASQGGDEFRQGMDDAVWLALGASFAAVSRGGGESGERRVLPVLSGDRMVLGPFMDFRRTFYHQAGSFVAAVWASLAILEDLVEQDVHVSDFAYNWVEPRVQSASGFLGLNKVCGLTWERRRRGEDVEITGQIRQYLRSTRGSAGGKEQDMARSLAYFVTTASVKYLETVVRLKARLVSEAQGPARRIAEGLFRTRRSLEEVRYIVMAGEKLPEIPIQLTWAIANWFKAQQSSEEGGGSARWTGDYIKMENASTVDRFLDVVKTIVSRASFNDPNSYSASGRELEKLASAAELRSPARFRAYKALFLLDVLSKVGGGRRQERTPSQETEG